MTTPGTDAENQARRHPDDDVQKIANASIDADVVNEQRHLESQSRDPFFIGVETALQDAGKKARKRAIALNGYVATWRDGKIVYDTEP